MAHHCQPVSTHSTGPFTMRSLVIIFILIVAGVAYFFVDLESGQAAQSQLAPAILFLAVGAGVIWILSIFRKPGSHGSSSSDSSDGFVATGGGSDGGDGGGSDGGGD